MSTILLATDWNLPIGWPNCLRRRACSMQRSSCRRIVPSVPARIAPRSHSIEQLKTSAPLPSRPSRASAGSCAILQRQLSHRHRADAELGDLAHDPEAGRLAGHDEGADAHEPLARVGRRVADEEVGHRAARHPGLAAVEHPAVAATLGAGLHAEDVRARLGLAGAVGADEPAVAEARQVAPLLLLGAIAEDRDRVGPHRGVDREDQAVVRAAVAEPLHRRDRGGQVFPLAPVFGRHRQPLDAELRAATPSLAPELASFVAPEQVVDQLGLREPDGRVVPFLLPRAQREIHADSPPCIAEVIRPSEIERHDLDPRRL